MASPQIENGHIDIANTIADKFCMYRLSGQEWQVVWVVLRKTWGWLKDPKNKNGSKKKMDRIALSQFALLTGIDRRKCHSILKKLCLKKIIKKSVTQKGDRITITYGFQKNFDLWKVSPKKVTVTQKGTKVSPKKAHTKETLKRKYTVNLKKFTEDYIKFIKEQYPTKKPHGKNLYENSIDVLDKLIRLNGFAEEYIFNCLRWAQKDDFWKGQVYSLSGLRKKANNGLLKFQNLSNAYDKDQPEQAKIKIPVFKVTDDE